MPIKVAQIVTVAQSLTLMRGWPRFLKEHGLEVHLVCTPADGLEEPLRAERIDRFHPISIPREISPLRDLVALWRLYRLIRRERFDLVHASTPKGGLLGTIAAWLARTPARIFTLRGLIGGSSRGLKRRILMFTDWLSMKLAHRVVAISPTLREEAIAFGLVAADKIVAIHKGSSNGVDAERFTRRRPARDAALRREWNLQPDDLVIGFVGRIVGDKGIVELAAAWPRIRATDPRVRLVIVGRPEPHDPVPPGLLEQLAADPHVRMAGWHADTAPCFEALDMLVLPTYREGFGNVLLEAGSMELPVVSSRVSGVSDAVVDGETGLLATVRDADALAAAVITLINDPERRQKMGQAARARVLRDFRHEIVWCGLLEEYRRVLRTAGFDVDALSPPARPAAASGGSVECAEDRADRAGVKTGQLQR